MVSTVITEIQAELLSEAIASPQLLADVAQLESYISETYSDRSFVELLQNADDAGAKRFHVILRGDRILCANDGRVFTDADLRSICRSGASTKTRGQTIGYRGIGFKSVASLAERVSIRSGHIAVVFDRDRTAQLTGLDRTKVPLIRIPHTDASSAVPERSDILTAGMQTLFIFEGIDTRKALSDLDSIGDDCLLFLRNIENVTLEVLGQTRSFSCQRTVQDGTDLLEIQTQAEVRQWEVHRAGGVDFAFAKSNGSCVPLRKEQSLVHAFLPSNEITGIGVRINGDFSTDPSRTRIVLDDRTLRLVDDVAVIILDMMRSGLLGGVRSDLTGCLSLNIDQTTIHFIKSCFSTELVKALRTRANGRFHQVALRPAWLNAHDFRQVADAAGFQSLPKQITDEADEALHQTMKMLGAKPVDDARLVAVLDPSYLSEQGRRDVLTQARKLHYLGTPLAQKFLALKGFAADKDGYPVTLAEMFQSERTAKLEANASVDPPFIARVDDILSPPALSKEVKRENTVSVSRWRQGEHAVGEIFRGQGYTVLDHSRQNLGYDLLAESAEGTFYIEVKTIRSPGEPFIMTTNEEVMARKMGNRYIIALQRELEDSVELAILRDPANTLQLDRQCRQWVWECSTYDYRPRRFPIG